MFDVDTFLDDCIRANQEDKPQLAIKELLERAMSDPGALADALPPERAEIMPLHRSPDHRNAAMRLLRSFDYQLVDDLGDLHRRLDVPVVLIWGEHDKFFPVDRARAMVAEFPNARLEVIPGAGLFAHEERPAEVARALLPTLTGRRALSPSLGRP